MRLKSHESPRQQGRNRRGRGGTARKRQLDKRNRTLMQRLRQGDGSPHTSSLRQGQFNPAFLWLLFLQTSNLRFTSPQVGRYR